MPNAEATAAITAPATRRSEARTNPLPRQAPRRPAIRCRGCLGEINASPSWKLACHLAINCGLGLLLRNAGGDLRFLAVDVAKADIAISPSWPRSERLAIYLRHRKATWACRHQCGAAEKQKAQLLSAGDFALKIARNATLILLREMQRCTDSCEA